MFDPTLILTSGTHHIASSAPQNWPNKTSDFLFGLCMYSLLERVLKMVQAYPGNDVTLECALEAAALLSMAVSDSHENQVCMRKTQIVGK